MAPQSVHSVKEVGMSKERLVSIAVLLILCPFLGAAFAEPGSTSGSGECKELRTLVSDLCASFIAGKDGGVACSSSLKRLANDEADCPKWIASLQRSIDRKKQGGLDDPWQWSEACQAYGRSFTDRCIAALGEGSSIDGCADEIYAVEFETAKMLRVPGNKYMAEEVEKVCKAKSAD